MDPYVQLYDPDDPDARLTTEAADWQLKDLVRNVWEPEGYRGNVLLASFQECISRGFLCCLSAGYREWLIDFFVERGVAVCGSGVTTLDTLLELRSRHLTEEAFEELYKLEFKPKYAKHQHNAMHFDTISESTAPTPAPNGTAHVQRGYSPVSMTKHKDLVHYDSTLPKDTVEKKEVNARAVHDNLEEEDPKGCKFTEEADVKVDEEKRKDEENVHQAASQQEGLGNNMAEKHVSDMNRDVDGDGFKKAVMQERPVTLVELEEGELSSSSLELIKGLEE